VAAQRADELLKASIVFEPASVLALAISGCDISRVNVGISDFRSKEVQGVWIWLSSPATGTSLHELQVVEDQHLQCGG
jgi:hypothetical protein